MPPTRIVFRLPPGAGLPQAATSIVAATTANIVDERTPYLPFGCGRITRFGFIRKRVHWSRVAKVAPMPASRHNARYKRLRAALREARKAAGLTQAQVGERLGRPQSYVNKYESGERRLDMIEFLDVANAIQLDIDELLQSLTSG